MEDKPLKKNSTDNFTPAQKMILNACTKNSINSSDENYNDSYNDNYEVGDTYNDGGECWE